MLSDPNLTVQDLIKEPLFCASCEKLMGKEEKYFAEVVFYPLHDKGQTTFEYDYHLGRFCAIQSFRVLVYFDYIFNELDRLKSTHSKLAKKAINLFRNLILSGGKKQNEFSNHVFFFDLVDFVGLYLPKAPKGLNQYCLRAIDMDIVHNHRVLFIFTKMCRIALMTFLVPKKPKGFKGTRVYAQGILKTPQVISFPGFGEFLYNKAEDLDLFDQKLSQKQKVIISRRYARNKSKMNSAESQSAFEADLELQILEKIRQRFKSYASNTS